MIPQEGYCSEALIRAMMWLPDAGVGLHYRTPADCRYKYLGECKRSSDKSSNLNQSERALDLTKQAAQRARIFGAG